MALVEERRHLLVREGGSGEREGGLGNALWDRLVKKALGESIWAWYEDLWSWFG